MSNIEKAIVFATEKHKTQFRKGGKIPYIVHPIEVMFILMNEQADEDAIIAGLLHDTVEDTKTTISEIEENFGERVAKIVGVESEIKGIPYRERKFEHMSRVAKASRECKMVNCADKLSNLKSIYIDHKYYGESVFDRFKGTKEDIKWYYGLAIEVLKDLSDTQMYQDLLYYYNELFCQSQKQM